MPSIVADRVGIAAQTSKVNSECFKKVHIQIAIGKYQEDILVFHANHLEDTTVISGREFPITLVFFQACDWNEEIRTNSGMNIGRRPAN